MDRGLEMLLDLDGSILVQTDAGHWIGIRAKRVASTLRRPHGISYSLTFHAPDNQRILGYDNAPRRLAAFRSTTGTGTPQTMADLMLFARLNSS